MLSITTDYVKDTGCPEPYLRRIGEAGFSHIHWCHHWNTDFLYSRSEILQIGRWLKDFGLQLLDLHASHGVEKGWLSSREYERLAGLELVKNRIEMAARLGSDVIIIHAAGTKEGLDSDGFWERVHKSLDDLEPFARKHEVRVAIENGDFWVIEKILSGYGPDYVGLCYDSGHGNIGGARGLDHLESFKERLISVHLHDNDGGADQHKLLFAGAVDWARLASILARSSYQKCVSMEVSMRCYAGEDEGAFLAAAFESGTVFSKMIESLRSRINSGEGR